VLTEAIHTWGHARMKICQPGHCPAKRLDKPLKSSVVNNLHSFRTNIDFQLAGSFGHDASISTWKRIG